MTEPGPDARPTGPAPSLGDLCGRRDEITRVTTRHGAQSVRVFGSVAGGDAGAGSDLDLLVELGGGRSFLDQLALQHALEDLLGCRVHITTTLWLRYASEDDRERTEHEAVPL